MVQRVFSKFSKSRRMATFNWASDLLCVSGPSTLDLGSSSSSRSKTERVTGPRSSRFVSRSAILTSCQKAPAPGPTGKSSDRFSASQRRRGRVYPYSERAGQGDAPARRTLPTPRVCAGQSRRQAPPESDKRYAHALWKGRARQAELFFGNERVRNAPGQFPAKEVRPRPGCVPRAQLAGQAAARQVRWHHCCRAPRRLVGQEARSPLVPAAGEAEGKCSLEPKLAFRCWPQACRQ